EQQNRAASLLFGAARSCELHADASQDFELKPRLLTESRLCYVALSEKFSSTDQGQEAAASLRRLSVVGQKLTQFDGPTIDGGQISAADFRGKATLIYFWESENTVFAEQFLPAINAVLEKAGSDKLRVIGVAMDEEEGKLNRFLDMHQVPGQQVFFPDAEQRSWNNPIVTWWGLARCPSIWLVDGTGKVVSTSAAPKNLTQEVGKLVR
ncbi:MAG: TlpA family protein disulfide reductase, partial [Planctomycetaceae bacterium]